LHPKALLKRLKKSTIFEKNITSKRPAAIRHNEAKTLPKNPTVVLTDLHDESFANESACPQFKGIAWFKSWFDIIGKEKFYWDALGRCSWQQWNIHLV